MKALVLLALLACAAPASARQYAHSQPVGREERTVWPKVRPPTPQAFFILQFADLNTQKFYQGWFDPYTLIACSIQSSATDFANFHNVGPAGVTFLGVVSGQSLPIYKGFSNPYNDGLTAAWDSSKFCIVELDSAKVMRVAGDVQWCPRQASVDSLIRVVADSAYGKVAWDGMYLDECTKDYPSYKETILGSTNFDCDGDGVADSKAKLRAQWHTWQPYLTTRLRAISGSKVLIGNSAGALGDPSLNGITIEDVGGGGSFLDSTAAIAALSAQKAVSRLPFVGGVFARNQAEVLSCLTVVHRIPGVYYWIHSDDGMP